MPTLNLDLIAPKTVDVTKTTPDGELHEWKLRADVPTSILVRCFYLLELEQRRPAVEIDLDAPISAEQVQQIEAQQRSHEDQEAMEVLAILGGIWRHTYAGTPDEDLRAWLSATERRQIVNGFFLILLSRLGRLPTPPAGGSPSTASPSGQTAETMPTMHTRDRAAQQRSPAGAAPAKRNSPRSRERDAIRSGMRSRADSSPHSSADPSRTVSPPSPPRPRIPARLREDREERRHPRPPMDPEAHDESLTY